MEKDFFEYTLKANKLQDDILDRADEFDEKDEEIYNQLEKNIKPYSFNRYLKRLIYRLMDQRAEEYTDEEYGAFIRRQFEKNGVAHTFSSTKLSVQIKNWLSKPSTDRKNVFLLGFGLGLSAKEVDILLTKGLLERGINPKVPLEAIAYYCMCHVEPRERFKECRWFLEAYKGMNATVSKSPGEETLLFNHELQNVRDKEALLQYLQMLKCSDFGTGSFTAKKVYEELYGQVREMIAVLFSDEHNTVSPKKITASNIESVLYASVPRDKNSNLIPVPKKGKNGSAGETFVWAHCFTESRLTRQRIKAIEENKTAVDRYDLMSLNFLIHACKQIGLSDNCRNPKTGMEKFRNSTDALLEKCAMGPMYPVNPYESVLLLCMMSPDPLCTFADLYEKAYPESKS